MGDVGVEIAGSGVEIALPLIYITKDSVFSSYYLLINDKRFRFQRLVPFD
jgi:hypothetical protein